jgi:membrane-associated phospholipid phosphatase
LDRVFCPTKWTRKAVGLLIAAAIWGLSGGAPLLAARGAGGENKFDGAYLRRLTGDFTAVITAPAHWTRSNLFTLAAVSGTGLLVMAFDQDIRDWAQSGRSESSDQASKFFSSFGNGAVLVGLSAAVYAVGAIGHDDGWRKTALLSLESLVTASLIVWTAKFVVGRARPYSGESSVCFHPFSLEDRFWSLPSGHATAAFSVATAIAMQAKSVWVDITSYSLAALAGLSRIHDDKHWASDVLIGSAIGYFVARKIVNLNRPGEKKSVSLAFECSKGRRAVTLNFGF